MGFSVTLGLVGKAQTLNASFVVAFPMLDTMLT
jgi:hypothetical protein